MYGSVLRGDLSQSISVGSNSFIGDNVVIHVSGSSSKHSTQIGDGTFIGSGAIIHGATIGNGCVIGQNATGVFFIFYFLFSLFTFFFFLMY